MGYGETQAILAGKISPTVAANKYIHNLFCIEALRYADVRNADLQVAWQYGQVTGAPWKDNPELVKQFFYQNRAELRKFVEQKLYRLCKRLADDLFVMKGDEDNFLHTPLEPQVKTSILRCLEDIDKSNILERLANERKISFASYSSEALVKHIHATLMPFEVCDRLLCGVFDNYDGGDPIYPSDNMKWKYMPSDVKQVLDHKVYTCQCRIKKFLEQFNFFDQDSLLMGHFSALASIFSILYRLSYPSRVTPRRLRDYYRWTEDEKMFMRYMQKARKFSHLCIEAVVDDKMPEFCPHIEEESSLGRGYSETVVYPDSLVERYLVTGYFYHECPCTDY